MEPQQLIQLHRAYHEAIENAERDPYRYGFSLPSWDIADEALETCRTLWLSGANRCLAGEQEIFDPVKGKSLRVDKIKEAFHVLAYDEANKCYVITGADAPFPKPAEDLFRIHLSSGEVLSCSARHRVLTSGGWKEVGDLSVGSSILGPSLGILEASQQLSYLQVPEWTIQGTYQTTYSVGGQHWIETPQDSQSGYQFSHCFCGEQPQSQEDHDLDAFPLESDALGHTDPCDTTSRSPQSSCAHSDECKSGDQACKLQHTPTELSFDLPSNQDDPPQPEALAADIECRNACTLSSPASEKSCCRETQQDVRQSGLELVHPEQASAKAQQANQFDEFSYGANRSTQYRIVKIEKLRNDKVWDFNVPVFHNYVAAGVINHNSSKTRYCAKKIVQAAVNNPKGLLYCWAQNDEISKVVQQRAVYEALPAEYRGLGSTKVASVNYSFKGGFTDKSFVLPNKTQVIFKTYTQWLQDDTILEGMELGSPEPTVQNIGSWLDEYLLGMDLIDRLMLRLATLDAKLLISFTPKDGETETVKNYRANAITLKDKVVSEGLKKETRVPLFQRNEQKNTNIVYFHSKDNPWSGYQTLLEQCTAKADDNYTLTALYGVPTKSAATMFPKFQSGNIVSSEFMKEKLKEKVTRYMCIDPAGSKPWFMVWVAVDSLGVWYIYREWPDVSHGNWAEEKNGKWVLGEACRQKLGYGVLDYVDLIRALESGEEVFERFIDPRAGAAKYSDRDGGQSDYITDLSEHSIYVAPAPRGRTATGEEEEHGLQKLQSLVSPNADGRSQLYISVDCQNLIKSFQEYDKSSRDHPLKDPLDCVRYLAEAEIEFIDPKRLRATRHGKGGY